MKAARFCARAKKPTPRLRIQTLDRNAWISRGHSGSAEAFLPARAGGILSQQPYSSSTAILPGHLRQNSLTNVPSNAYATVRELKKTPLYDLHLAHGAKMVPFGGYHMPVQYADQSVSASHFFTRTHSSLFDVGHMVQHRFNGPGATAFLQRITPAGLEKLGVNSSTLSAILWPKTGGIVDDTIITKLGDNSFYVVTNAACRDKDLSYLNEQLKKWEAEGRPSIEHKVMENWGLVALQGPFAETVLRQILVDPKKADLTTLLFGQCRYVDLKVDGGRVVENILVSRGGYTGEDGFEISLPPQDTADVTEALLNVPGPDKLPMVKLAGLGARDSLRLEAGMCLYGHDLDDTTTPVEGSLSWIIAKERRTETDVEKGAFYGADVILKQLTPKSKGGAGVERRRIGLTVEGAPAREGAKIVDADGNEVGVVTSGCPSPTLDKNIAMGYIKDGLHKAGTEVDVLVRGKPRKAVVTKMPFVSTKYWKGIPHEPVYHDSK
ncbi:glycine cleavage system T protein [Hypoxylon sp. FL0890]|nr:glycine cleavage system T protein [Hypoxylon sp. FL0890]